MNALIALLFQVSALQTPSHEPAIRIEVDEKSDQFRIIVESEKRTRFNAYQLEAPHDNFPPASAGVLVKQEGDNVVGCQEDNRPNYSVELSSSSRAANDRKMTIVKKGQPYITPWYPSQSLFYFFDECVDLRVNPGGTGGYRKYQILVDIETSRGEISTKTDWLDFHDFGTSQWGRKREGN